MENDKITNSDSQPENEKSSIMSGQNPAEKPIGVFKSLYNRILANKRLFAVLRISIISIASVLVILFFITFILYLLPGLQEITSGSKTKITGNQELQLDKNYKKQIGLLTKDIQRLSKKYNAYTSGQSYIVINTTDNRFFLYRNKKLIREGFCSTGSLIMLKTESGDKEWVFKTPKGKHWVQGKITNPSWRRPDWSFVEEGLPIPPKDDPSRYEYGVLGDYAMSIGDGYLIHGTIYKRFLGMPVTHGCVRLNDEDLEVIFNTLNIGSKVYIF